MRSATGTKSGPPSLVTRVTKSIIPRLAAHSFQDGSGSASPFRFCREPADCAAPNPNATASKTTEISRRITRRLLYITYLLRAASLVGTAVYFLLLRNGTRPQAQCGIRVPQEDRPNLFSND